MKEKNKKKVIALASIFALLALLAGTFAWFTSKDDKTNHFEGEIATGRDIEVVETFDPPTDWEPGAEVDKKVAIANIGKYDTLVRVTLEEALKLLADPNVKTTTTGTELAGKNKADTYIIPGTDAPTGFVNSTFDGAAPVITVSGSGDLNGTYTLKVKEKSEVVGTTTKYTYRYVFEKGGVLYYANGINGFERNAAGQIKVKSGAPALSYVSLTYGPVTTARWDTPPYAAVFTADGTNRWNVPALSRHIQITFNNITTSAADDNKWVYNRADGYFYYTSIVKPGANTTQLMDAVKLLGTADNSYSKLVYDLKVEGEGISAYKDAVDQWLPAGTNDTLATALKAKVPAK